MIRIKSYGISEIGSVRENNEDNLYMSGTFRNNTNVRMFSYGLEKITDCALFAVCDGMGGEAFGEEASWIAVSGLSFIENHLIRKSKDDFSDLIISYLRQANKRVCDRIKEHNGTRMGTTFAGLCLRHESFQVANLGDSRIYLYRDNKLTQLTKDHTQAQNLADLGIIDQAAVKSHPDRHALIQHLGIFPQEFLIEPSLSVEDRLLPNDIFILCSDGLSDQLSENCISDFLSQDEGLNISAEKLVGQAMSSGGKDNITLIIIKVIAVDSNRLTQNEEDIKLNTNSITSDNLDKDANNELTTSNTYSTSNTNITSDTKVNIEKLSLDTNNINTAEIDLKDIKNIINKNNRIPIKKNLNQHNNINSLKVDWPNLPDTKEKNNKLKEELYSNSVIKKQKENTIISNKKIIESTQLFNLELKQYSDTLNIKSTTILPTAVKLINKKIKYKEPQYQAVLFSKNPPQPITTDDLDRFKKAKQEAIKRQNKQKMILPDEIRYGVGFKGFLRKFLKIDRNIDLVYQNSDSSELRKIKRKRLLIEIIKTFIYILIFSIFAYIFYGALKILFN